MSIFKSFFGGLSGLIRGPKSPGSPTPTLESIDQAATESATLSAYRQDIVRRNAARRSSTNKTGAEFVEAMQSGFNDQGPVPETQKVAQEQKQEVVDTASMSLASLEAKYGADGAAAIIRKEMAADKYKKWQVKPHPKRKHSGASARKSYQNYLQQRATRLAGK